ncbi:MAG: Bcr/CflA family multidrug efflux MFS transporter [Phycisphaerales bacterium]|nr:Bcr/CflA family multidrug efflux MFS transporter [Phycisphaerales bacterium]
MNRDTTSTQNGHSELFFLIVLGMLMAFTSLSTDIYLPAMPQMARDFQASVELTITGFLIGFALAQIVWGPISDHFGRRYPLIAGLLLFIVGSAGCALSQTIGQIVFWRVIQAFGACTGPMLARAMVRDLYQRTQAARMLSTLMVIMAIAPIIGPLFGGQVIRVSTWHTIFWLLCVIGAVMVAAVLHTPETLSTEKRAPLALANSFRVYFGLLRHTRFMRYVLSLTFFYVAAYAFIAGSPFVYIDYYGIDPQHYGWLFAINIVGVMVISLFNRRLVEHFQLDTLLRWATLIAALCGVLLALFAKWHIGGIYGLVLPIFAIFSTNGIIAATSTAAALDEVPVEIAGSASALIGSLQYGSGIISSLMLAGLASGTPWTMAWIMALFTVISALTAWLPEKMLSVCRSPI